MTQGIMDMLKMHAFIVLAKANRIVQNLGTSRQNEEIKVKAMEHTKMQNKFKQLIEQERRIHLTWMVRAFQFKWLRESYTGAIEKQSYSTENTIYKARM